MCGRSLAGIVFSRFAIFSMLRRAAGRSRIRAGVINSCRCRPMAEPYAWLTRCRVSWIAPTAGARSSGMVPHTGECVDARSERVDGRAAVEDADLEVVRSCFAWSQISQLAALARVETSGITVGGRLHGHSVGPFAEHPPHRVEGKLILLVDLVGAEPEFAVDDRHRDGSRRLGDNLVLVALLRKSRRGGGQAPVLRAWILSDGHAGRSRDEVLGTCVDDGPTDVH